LVFGPAFAILRTRQQWHPIVPNDDDNSPNSVRLIVSQTRKLILKLLPPDALAARPIAQWITRLNHKLAYHAMEDNVIVISILGMGDEVLDGFRGSFRKETNVDVAVCRVDDGGGT